MKQTGRETIKLIDGDKILRKELTKKIPKDVKR